MLALVNMGAPPVLKRDPTSIVGGAYGKRERLRRAQFGSKKALSPVDIADSLNYKLHCEENAAVASEVQRGARLMKPRTAAPSSTSSTAPVAGGGGGAVAAPSGPEKRAP